MALQVGDHVQLDGYRGDGIPRSGVVEAVKPGLLVLKERVKQGYPQANYRAYRTEYLRNVQVIEGMVYD